MAIRTIPRVRVGQDPDAEWQTLAADLNNNFTELDGMAGGGGNIFTDIFTDTQYRGSTTFSTNTGPTYLPNNGEGASGATPALYSGGRLRGALNEVMLIEISFVVGNPANNYNGIVWLDTSNNALSAPAANSASTSTHIIKEALARGTAEDIPFSWLFLAQVDANWVANGARVAVDFGSTAATVKNIEYTITKMYVPGSE